jgi:hypothetical protein
MVLFKFKLSVAFILAAGAIAPIVALPVSGIESTSPNVFKRALNPPSKGGKLT